MPKMKLNELKEALAIMTGSRVRTGARAQLLVLLWLAREGMEVR